MKLTKKILLAAVAVAAVMFAGCKNWSLSSAMQKSFGADMFKYNDATYDAGLGTWKIEGKTNETEDYMRGAKLLMTKHSDMSGIVEINDGYNASAGRACGNVGLVFDVTKKKVEDAEGNKKELWNFCVIGIQADGTSSARYYISYFANISDEDMSANNFGAYDPVTKQRITKTTFEPNCDTPYEIELKGWTTLSGVTTNGNVSVVVDVKEVSAEAAELSKVKAGSYTVSFYKDEVLSNNHTLNILGKTPISACVINADKIGKEGAAQAYVGVYGNIYAGDTMDGSLEILDLTHQALPVEE